VSRRRRRRHSDSAAGDDPLTLIPNLFDVAIVLAVAFLVAALSISRRSEPSKQQPGQSRMESGLETAGKKLEDSQDRRKTSGKGVRLGTAYRLENGEVIYVPE
jgi:hypothetical protein